MHLERSLRSLSAVRKSVLLPAPRGGRAVEAPALGNPALMPLRGTAAFGGTWGTGILAPSGLGPLRGQALGLRPKADWGTKPSPFGARPTLAFGQGLT